MGIIHHFNRLQLQDNFAFNNNISFKTFIETNTPVFETDRNLSFNFQAVP